MFGRMLNETLGKIHFWGTVIPFNVIFIPLFITGIAGDQRRVYNYAQFAEQSRPALQHLRTTSTIALLVMLSFQFGFLFNFVWSLRSGKSAGANPWRSTTLEWTVPSPPPHGNFATLPTVYRGPYEYGVPGRADDYFPQNVPD
jgi:cytochrome c oxidase subunit 1